MAAKPESPVYSRENESHERGDMVWMTLLMPVLLFLGGVVALLYVVERVGMWVHHRPPPSGWDLSGSG